jgi:putative photosynthetic complex assembly protein 2
MFQTGQTVCFALFVWYFSTGVILYLDGLPVRTFRWSMLGITAINVASLFGLAELRDDTSVSGAYLGFACGVLAWAWQEMAFLMGFATGMRRQACEHGCGGWQHFGHAVQAVLYHELAIVAGAALVVMAAWGGANQVGTWTFMVLWGMRQSAKLNVFLGVRNLNEELLPPHLAFLKSFLTCKPMNLLFPVSVTGATILAVVLVQRAGAPGIGPFAATGLVLLATMTILGLVEHWFLVLPVPFARLWDWGLVSRRRPEAAPAHPSSWPPLCAAMLPGAQPSHGHAHSQAAR